MTDEEEMLGLRQEHIAEEGARAKETAEEKEEKHPRKCPVKGVAEALQTSTDSLKSLKITNPTPKSFH